jgi:hypothetical protein
VEQWSKRSGMGERRRGEVCSLTVGLRKKRGCKGAGHPEREGVA